VVVWRWGAGCGLISVREKRDGSDWFRLHRRRGAAGFYLPPSNYVYFHLKTAAVTGQRLATPRLKLVKLR
jgi:hypothetical protein